MKIIVSLLLIANLLVFTCTSQLFIEPVIGYQLDMNRSGFKQINSVVQFSFKKGSHYEFILLLQKSWPISFISQDSDFTANPSFPLYATAQKTIQPGSFAVSTGHRFVVAGSRGLNIFSILLNTGFIAQKIKVSYQYDKVNYAILNPDKTQSRTNIFVSAGVEYMRLLKNGRLFFQLNVSSPPAGGQIKYPSSFTFMAPLNLNAGYSIPIKKTVK